MRHFNKIFFLLGLLVVGGFGFAASNTVPASSAGDGEAVISGYTVSNVTYGLASDPTLLDSVSFTLSGGVGTPPPGNVQVKLVEVGGAWFGCSGGALPSTYTCAISGSVAVLDADELRVIAAK